MYNNSDNGFGRPSNLPTSRGDLTTPRVVCRPLGDEGQHGPTPGDPPGSRYITVRTDPITDEEVQYLKYMEDTSELAKFDQYVESFIDHKLSRGVLFWW